MRLLITGASGFIGGSYAAAALDQNHSVLLTSRDPRRVARLVARGAHLLSGDPYDPKVARAFCSGVDAVIHCAGAVGTLGSYKDFYRANVTMTQILMDAASQVGVPRVVFLSSPSIYFTGRSRRGISERDVPRRFYDRYGETKFQAEQYVLSGSTGATSVIALRPRFVVGSGDNGILPRMIAAQKQGSLRVIGSGQNIVDFTNIHNVVDAMDLALLAAPEHAGRAYNISNGAPVLYWDAVRYVLNRLGLGQPKGRVPAPLARGRGWFNEKRFYVRPSSGMPSLTRLTAAVMSTDFTLDITEARAHLGYAPSATVWQAFDEFCG